MHRYMYIYTNACILYTHIHKHIYKHYNIYIYIINYIYSQLYREYSWLDFSSCSELVALSGNQEAHANVWSVFLEGCCFCLSLPNWLRRQVPRQGAGTVLSHLEGVRISKLIFHWLLEKKMYVCSYKMNISICCHVALQDLQFECLLPPYACFSIDFIMRIYVYIYICISCGAVIVSTLIGLTSESGEV